MAWWLRSWTPDPEVRGRCVVTFSKTNLLTKISGNTQKAVATHQHDWKIVYRDIKNKINQPTLKYDFKLYF